MRQTLLLVVFVLLSGFAAAQDLQPIPKLTLHVTDQTGTLQPSEAMALESKLAAFEQQKGSQVVVVIVPTTVPEAIEQYSIRLAEAAKVGRKKIDDGVILLIAKNDHKMRIEVGYGLEGAIPDALAFRIIDETLKPAFRAGDFAGGVDKATDQILGLINGEALPLPPKTRNYDELGHKYGTVIALAFIALLYMADFFVRRFGSVGGPAAIGVVGGIIGGIVAQSILSGIVFSIFIFLIIQIRGASSFAYLGTRGFGSNNGFGSGGGFGGGGFSGGGGGFGGGGASGGW